MALPGSLLRELNDVIDLAIVKEAIINNSDVKILLDQSKFKDRSTNIRDPGSYSHTAATNLHHQQSQQS